MSSSLVYTKPQIRSILNKFVEKFNDENFLAILRDSAPDENAIDQLITNAQENIFKDEGVDPKRGFQDMSKIGMYYSNDDEIMALLANVAMKEDNAINYALF